MNRWPYFRMYAESRNDRKLDTLADDEFRVWHRLLCFASEQEERGAVEVCDRLLLAIEVARGDEELLARTLRRLAALRIIADDGERITFLNFAKRNYDKPSDTPAATAERKRRQREREREGAGQTRDEGVTDTVSRDVTPRHAPEEKREEKKKPEESKPTPPPPTGEGPAAAPPDAADTSPPRSLARQHEQSFEAFWRVWPKKEGKAKALAAWVKLRPGSEAVQAIIEAIPRHQAAKDWARENWRYCPLPATWLNERRWEDELPDIAPRTFQPVGKDAERIAVFERFAARRQQP